MFKKVFMEGIHLYQKYISSQLPRRCRYYPTCSAYAYGAIEKHGVIRGMVMAIWRVLRCNPFSAGGYDPVPDTFKAAFAKREEPLTDSD